MAAQLIDGNKIAADIKADVSRRVSALKARGISPGLAAIIVGDNAASISYVSGKAADCAEVGIFSETFHLPESSTHDEVLALIARLNADNRFHAILPQLPMPRQIDEREVIDAMLARKDADGLHPVNLGRLLRGELDGAIPCTPNGVLELLRRTGIDPAGKHVVVVGRSTLVGRPLAVLLSNKANGANATVTICHTGTPDIARFTRDAEIVVLAAGHVNTLTADMCKPGVVIIDVGVNRVDAPSRPSGYRLVGDAAMDVREVASWVTPYTGGVGPMTRAMLLVNTVRAAEKVAG
ncbi:MAG: bifunctional 5,10-methylene-tetrahydrofolate dehydrogenase/5,10-methylene-tetrahydrofolate cyclohydrolase [Dehalococcoidia bacterium]|uniref:bifunctional 5,10-methylenetetrahydrofolate dehydrogenase/5,10-methenyltetrahydrofolate cyclohydrolase n=1 Tax=Candidatus Amarobacter glycogenicus TaxID=3140699 RepID=UPI002A0D0EB8|nr:bifunctional 5,10-methylene-tetrahydrofolate dehydrogenase/5,10-methylene-tetrahydrofolate cyclohydrolase [Dehalococcoidia bacterium]MBK9546238.1 bifunctional 5,10-methylene-tetrahydrofolate dehydrogenase/5,10-methylene-tetrahydrofolate cyclohydrolase [Dehalococcoidia bacterium]MBK9612318.1 bifunctional 5,10-methylene-tetrahydrofolate dehydrogenase/5,10-methylene-tetrahydrofolate cyclohydrolase [Dehalococcoidia bacterium]